MSAALLLHCCCSDDARMCLPVAAERRLDCARMRCRGQEGTLPGCSNDAKCIEYMLKHRFGFRVVSGGVGAQQLGARQAVSAVPRLASTHYGGWLAAAFCQPSAALLPFSSLSYSLFFPLPLQEDMMILREDLRDPQRSPTRSNMMQVGACSCRQQCSCWLGLPVLLCSLAWRPCAVPDCSALRPLLPALSRASAG